MPGTHGDLYSEIGQLVVAANAGQALDLAAASEELSQRYAHLNVPPDAMARAIARSLGAVGVSTTLLGMPKRDEPERSALEAPSSDRDGEPLRYAGEKRRARSSRKPSLFPSGVRLALLS